MDAWWLGLNLFAQICFVVASTGTLLMIAQLVLLLIGWGHDGDADVDSGIDSSLSDIGGLKVFTIRGVIIFFAIGAWVAYIAKDLPIWASMLIGIVAGGLSSLLFAYAFKSVFKLQEEGNIRNENAIGKKATVYLTIPAANNGTGKINLVIQERLVELDAVTDSKVAFKTGETVLVSSINSSGVLVVEKIKDSKSNQNSN